LQQLLLGNRAATVDTNEFAAESDIHISEVAVLIDVLINNISTALLIQDENNVIVFVNDGFATLFNVPIPPSELVGKTGLQLRKLIGDMFVQVEAYEQTIEWLTEQKIVAKDQQIELIDGRVLELDYTPIFVKGVFVGHIWNYKNVTEKILSNKRLQAQRRLFETILNHLPVDVAVFNPDYSDLFLNPIAIKDAELRKWMIDWMIGKEADYLYGRPQNNTGNRLYFNQVLRTKNLVSWEEERPSATGQYEYFLRNMFPVLDESGDIIMIIGYNVNISDRKKIEQQISLSEKRYRDLINYSNALICTHDVDGTILSINPAISMLLGYTNNEMVGTKIDTYLTLKSKSTLKELYLQKLETKGSNTGVFSILAKSGQKYYLLYQNYKVVEEGQEPYVVLFAQDITDRIKAEKELLVAKKMTEEAALAKEAFLANMSHEIRTPMNGIMGVTNLLSKTQLDTQQKDYLKLIADSANNLLVIVNDVLDIEKIASGKLELEQIPFRMVEKLSNAVQSFQYKTEEKGLQLAFENYLPDTLVTIGDPYRLVQIINNLINNAIKFTNEGKITVTAELVSHSRQDNTVDVAFKIVDTGIGIEPDRIEAVFDPYVQAASDTTRKYGGTGLGLSICKNLIEMQNGNILVTSNVGEGTTFSFYLSYGVGTENDLLPALEEDVVFVGLEGKNVLVAEDVEINQFLAKTLLESWGCMVTIVENGKDAVEIIEQQSFDIVLMDVHMPEMDGLTATRLIRQMATPSKSSVPIIALTANALKGNEELYLETGMNYYISKPYTELNLFLLICKALQVSVKKQPKSVTTNTTVAPDVLLSEQRNMYNVSQLEAMSKGKPGFVKRMIEIFVLNVPLDMQKLQQAVANTDWETAGKIAHRMKPSIDGMGITTLKNTVRQIENFAKEQKHIEEIPLLAEQLISTLELVVQQLKTDFDSIAS